MNVGSLTLPNLIAYPRGKRVLAGELIALGIVIPGLITLLHLAPYMLVFLWGIAGYCLWRYRKTLYKNGERIWKWDQVTLENMTPIVIRWAILSVCMVLFMVWYDEPRFFSLPHTHPYIWLGLMMTYPVLSALPQEFIFCTYFFNRYHSLFTERRHMIYASTLIFAFAHLMFFNMVAPVLCLIGGYLFATTFDRHRSLALVTIEHALYGNTIFTIGLGWYFWGQAVGM